MQLRHVLPWFAAAMLATAEGRAQYIGVFSNTSTSDCNIPAQQYTPGHLYVLYVPNSYACAAITGAEFRVEGFPAGWFYSTVADPRIVGDPGDALGAGARISFSSCQTPETGAVLLSHIQFFSMTTVFNQYLTITQHSTPRNPEFQCPVLILCDDPAFTAMCVRTGEGAINMGGWGCCQWGCPEFRPCPPVAVGHTTWSHFKSLYE